MKTFDDILRAIIEHNDKITASSEEDIVAAAFNANVPGKETVEKLLQQNQQLTDAVMALAKAVQAHQTAIIELYALQSKIIAGLKDKSSMDPPSITGAKCNKAN